MVTDKENKMDLRKAIEVVADYGPSVMVAEVYDEDHQFAEALGEMFPNFEYPDFSHLTVQQVLVKFERGSK
jgi:hypothetical protein